MNKMVKITIVMLVRLPEDYHNPFWENLRDQDEEKCLSAGNPL